MIQLNLVEAVQADAVMSGGINLMRIKVTNNSAPMLI